MGCNGDPVSLSKKCPESIFQMLTFHGTLITLCFQSHSNALNIVLIRRHKDLKSVYYRRIYVSTSFKNILIEYISVGRKIWIHVTKQPVVYMLYHRLCQFLSKHHNFETKNSNSSFICCQFVCLPPTMLCGSSALARRMFGPNTVAKFWPLILLLLE